MGCNNSHDSSENSQGEADMPASRKYSSRRSSSVSNNTGDRSWRRPQQSASLPSSASNSPRSPDTASKRRRRSLLLRQSSVLSDRDGTDDTLLGTDDEGSTDDADWNPESGDTGSRRSDQQRPRRRSSSSGRSTVGTLFDAPAQNGYRLRLKQSNSNSDRRTTTNNDDDEEDEDDDVPTHRSHNQQLAERNRRKRKNSQKKNNQPPPQTNHSPPRYGSLRRTPSMTTHDYSGMSDEEAAKARAEDEQKHLESIRQQQRKRLRKGGYLAPNSKLDHYKKLLQTVGRESGEDDDDGWLNDVDGVADPSSPDFCADNNSVASGIQVISRKASVTSDGWGDVGGTTNNNGNHNNCGYAAAFQPPPSDDNNSAHSSAQSPRSILRKSSSYLMSQPSSFVGSLRHPSQHASFQGGGGLGTRPASVLLGGGGSTTDEGSDCGGEVSVPRGNDSIFSLQMSGFSTTGGASSSGLAMPSPLVNSAPPPQQQRQPGTPLQLPENFFDEDDNLPSFIRCDLAPSARGPPSAAHQQQLPGAVWGGSATGYPSAQPQPSAPNFSASASGSLVMGTTTPTSIHSPTFHQQPGGGGGGSVSSRCSSRSSARVMFRE